MAFNHLSVTQTGFLKMIQNTSFLYGLDNSVVLNYNKPGTPEVLFKQYAYWNIKQIERLIITTLTEGGYHNIDKIWLNSLRTSYIKSKHDKT